LAAIKEYENNKWKVIGQKVNKPAKACEQHAKEHFPGKSSLIFFDLIWTRSLTSRQSCGPRTLGDRRYRAAAQNP
jgi:hypothetical protein